MNVTQIFFSSLTFFVKKYVFAMIDNREKYNIPNHIIANNIWWGWQWWREKCAKNLISENGNEGGELALIESISQPLLLVIFCKSTILWSWYIQTTYFPQSAWNHVYFRYESVQSSQGGWIGVILANINGLWSRPRWLKRCTTVHTTYKSEWTLVQN